MIFNENLNKIFHINCYDESREKYWEFVAADRERFRTKILKYSVIINPILEYNHRLRVYKEMYEIKQTYVNKYFYCIKPIINYFYKSKNYFFYQVLTI